MNLSFQFEQDHLLSSQLFRNFPLSNLVYFGSSSCALGWQTVGDHPTASRTSGAQISTEDKQRGRASRNHDRCAVIIAFAREVGSVYFITLHTF